MAWGHLERAHILSQSDAARHTWVHGVMLLRASQILLWAEIFAQLPRLLLAAPGSWLGRAPKGSGCSSQKRFQVTLHRS
jgi:hypothetical protein